MISKATVCKAANVVYLPLIQFNHSFVDKDKDFIPLTYKIAVALREMLSFQ
jgi:hypothetical protein